MSSYGSHYFDARSEINLDSLSKYVEKEKDYLDPTFCVSKNVVKFHPYVSEKIDTSLFRYISEYNKNSNLEVLVMKLLSFYDDNVSQDELENLIDETLSGSLINYAYRLSFLESENDKTNVHEMYNLNDYFIYMIAESLHISMRTYIDLEKIILEYLHFYIQQYHLRLNGPWGKIRSNGRVITFEVHPQKLPNLKIPVLHRKHITDIDSL